MSRIMEHTRPNRPATWQCFALMKIHSLKITTSLLFRQLFLTIRWVRAQLLNNIRLLKTPLGLRNWMTTSKTSRSRRKRGWRKLKNHQNKYSMIQTCYKWMKMPLILIWHLKPSITLSSFREFTPISSKNWKNKMNFKNEMKSWIDCRKDKCCIEKA